MMDYTKSRVQRLNDKYHFSMGLQPYSWTQRKLEKFEPIMCICGRYHYMLGYTILLCQRKNNLYHYVLGYYCSMKTM